MTAILNIPEADYHADAIEDRPSLSASVATILCAQSPAHARAAHPRLNADLVREEAAHFDLGTCAHALLLEGRSKIEVVPHDDWRTNAAKAMRDEARAAGRIPLLSKDSANVTAMVAAAREKLEAHHADPPLFKDGKAEQTLVWDDGGVLCRARLDWLRDDHTAIDDYKTVGRSADSEKWSRSICDHGYDVQVAFYLRGLRALDPAAEGVTRWRWVVQETSPPYELVVIEPGADVLALGERKVKYALARWAECVASGVWPGYPARVHTAELAPWDDVRWLAKEEREQVAA